METFSYSVQSGINAKSKPNINKVQFGNGYQQRSKNGINNNLRAFTVTYIDTWNKDNIKGKRTIPEYVEVENFLKRHEGYKAFMWGSFIDPYNNNAQIKVFCNDWTVTHNQGYVEISMTFEETV